MAHPNYPQTEPYGMPKVEVQGRMFTPREMMAVALIGTMAATGLANYYNGENGRAEIPAIELNMDSHSSKPADSANTSEKTSESQTPAVGEVSDEQVTAIADTMGETWARQFADDVKAGKLIDPARIDSLADRLKAQVEAGHAITKISVGGTTSAEDNSVDAHGRRTAGLQETSPSAAKKQEELGDKRRDMGTLELAAALHERGIDIDPSMIELIPSVEDVLSDDEAKFVQGLAGKFGYSSETEMIETWNREPEKVPPAVDAFLTAMLAKERTFRVEVELSKPTDSVSVSDTPKDNPESNHPNKGSEESSHDRLRLLPFALPGYLLISASRRRRLVRNAYTTQGYAGASPKRNNGGSGINRTSMASSAPIRPAAGVSSAAPNRNGSGSSAAPNRSGMSSAAVPPANMGPSSVPRFNQIKLDPVEPLVGPPSDGFATRRFELPEDSEMPQPVFQNIGHRRKQPRPHNFHGQNGHLPRSRGGDRRGKRIR